MFRIPRRKPWPPQLDTATVRSELGRIRQNLEQVPDLRTAALIIAEAIDELQNAEARSRLGNQLSQLDISRYGKEGGKR